MPGNRRIQCQVAIEMGYQKELVVAALEEYDFTTAGALVEYLMDEEANAIPTVPKKSVNDVDEVKIVTDDKVVTNDMKQVAVTDVNENSKEKKKELSLREETEILYRNSICLVCHERKRAFVNCPCGHLSHCGVCNLGITRCRFPTSATTLCDETILSTIHVYSV